MALHGLTSYLSSTPPFKSIAESLKKRAAGAVLCGPTDSSKSVSIAAAASLIKKPVLIISPTYEEAGRLFNELSTLMKGRDVSFFPAPDNATGERLEVLNSLLEDKQPIIVAPVKAVISRTITPAQLKKSMLILKKGMKISIDEICENLVSMGYRRFDIVGERGEFAVRGGIVDVFPSSSINPVRADFVGDEIEDLKFFDVRFQRSADSVKTFTILPATEAIASKKDVPTILDYLDDALLVMDDEIQLKLMIRNLFDEAKIIKADEEALIKEDTDMAVPVYLPQEKLESRISGKSILEISGISSPDKSKNRRIFTVNFTPPQSYHVNREKLSERLKERPSGVSIIVSKQPHRVIELLADVGVHGAYVKDLSTVPAKGVVVCEGELSGGFILDEARLECLTDREIFGERLFKGAVMPVPLEGVDSSLLVELSPGEYVVHENYGVGIYRGLERLNMEGFEQEYILIDYAADDKLFVPLSQMGLVQKYSSSSDYAPRLNRLGGREWGKTKKKAMESLEDLTAELLDLYATREKTKGYAFPGDTAWQSELAAGFPYEETPDQIKAINEVREDMESPRVMERLICGDVGYGKTEVALRAAFKAATSGKQVAILVPTTILAEQHYNNFKRRFAAFPVAVEMLSRFRSKNEQKEILEKVAAGEVDCIIGTHRLLQKDVKFKDLGLLVIDEEQRFGVKHKERLKKLRRTVDVLTMTATPIPRTLYMSLSGARDMSMISTPPLDRSPIKTRVMEWSKHIIREAILRELERGGQVYYVYNRVEDIEKVAAMLKSLIPAARIAVAHGQMGESGLEKTMLEFMERAHDVLLCTTIIESGIDIPNVNTIIIDGASNFGLSQLYQLRGRVGRSAARAYAYLLYHKEDLVAGAAVERLKAINEFTSLGSGYRLALRDLEIRGAGNILGKEQHGHMVALGFDLYCDLVERAVAKAKGEEEAPSKDIIVDINIDAFIPEDFISDERQRIAYYRRMNLLTKTEKLKDMRAEVMDRFGEIPKIMDNLFRIIEFKILAGHAGIKQIKQSGVSFMIDFIDSPDVPKIEKVLDREKAAYKISGKRLTLRRGNLKPLLEHLAKV